MKTSESTENRPMILVSMGNTAELTIKRFFDDARRTYGKRTPFHVAWAQLRELEQAGRIGLRVASRCEDKDSSDGGFDDLQTQWSNSDCTLDVSIDAASEDVEAVATRLLDEASRLCRTERREAAARDDDCLVFDEEPPEIVFLIDDQDEDSPWWRWATQLGEQCLMGHRVEAFVFCRWQLPARDASPLAGFQRFRQDLIGRLRFSQLYLIGDLNQKGSDVHPREQSRIVSGYLLDRSTGCSEIDEAASPDWIDPSDDPALHLWSLNHKTLSFEPDKLIGFLKSRAYLNHISREMGSPMEAHVTSPDRGVLEQLVRSVLVPNPRSLPGGNYKQASTWPLVDHKGIDEQIGAYFQSIWSVVDELLNKQTPNLGEVCQILRASRNDVLTVSERLQLDSVAADRAQKAHHLEAPTATYYNERTETNPTRFILQVLGSLLGIGAVLGGVAMAAANALDQQLMVAIGIGGLAALMCFVLSLFCKDQVIRQPYAVARELPYDMNLILATRRCLATLYHRILIRLDRAEEIAQRWQKATERAAMAKESEKLPHGLTEEELERIDAKADEAHVATFEQVAQDFSSMVRRAIHGDQSVDDVFDPFEHAFKPIYQFIYEWDVETLLAVTREETVEDVEAEWKKVLQLPWQVSDQDMTSQPVFTRIVTKRPTPSGLQVPSRVRVYKFCVGIDPAAIPGTPSNA